MQAVSTARRLVQGAARRVEFDLQPVAISHMGNRYSGALSFGGKTNEIPCGSHKVFYEVDRG